MILISINEPNFEYDIHSLVQAFYPGREVLVRVFSPEELAARADEAERFFTVTYGADAIRIALYAGVGEDEPLLTREVRVDPSDRTDTKNRLKQTLYRLLAEYTGRTLPWGTLTGIRPVKIAMAMLEEGKNDEDVRAYMRDMFFTADEKIDLSIEIARREQAMLADIDYARGYSLYIGIPFCPSTCLYCSFPSFSIDVWRERVDEYLEALGREIRAIAPLCKDKQLQTIYIGGGTPTSLSPSQLDELLGRVEDCFDQTHLLEYTVEAGRPDSITADKLRVLRDHRIARISINPQTMNEATLRLIGRAHTVEQTVGAFERARAAGFDNINMDLIVGLPEEDIEAVRHTLDEVARLAPESVTVHSLAVKRAARLAMERERYEHLRIENTWETIRLAAERCRAMGLAPYYLYRQKNTAGNFENVGYAAPGREGIYNVLIMEEKQSIVALGAGATSKAVFDGGARIERSGNVKDVGIYMDRIDEMIDRKQRFLEKYNW